METWEHMEAQAMDKWNLFINPYTSEDKRLSAREKLDVLLAKSIQISRKLREVIERCGFPMEGLEEKTIGPPLTWLGTSSATNYMGSPQIDPLTIRVTSRNPHFEIETIRYSIGRLLRRIYHKYIADILKEMKPNQQDLAKKKRSSSCFASTNTTTASSTSGGGGEEQTTTNFIEQALYDAIVSENRRDKPVYLNFTSDRNVPEHVFCSFEKCRKALKDGHLDGLMLSVMENYRDLICTLGFSVFLFMWDQSHMEEPSNEALRMVRLFHSQDQILPLEEPMFSSYRRTCTTVRGDEGDAMAQEGDYLFTDCLKKSGRQSVMDAWNIEINPYEKVRHFQYDDVNIRTTEIYTGPAQDSSNPAEYFGMSEKELADYRKMQRNFILCMPEFTILQTVVLRAIVSHELQRCLPEELKKSKVGLIIHCWEDTMIDLCQLLLCDSRTLEEMSDTYMESSGIYKMLYPHGRRFNSYAGNLPDATNRVKKMSAWREIKSSKNTKLANFHHLYFDKELPQRCKIRNVRKMISDYTKEYTTMTYLLRDTIHMTLTGGYPACGVRPTLTTKIMLKVMSQAFSKKSYKYFLSWVNNNRRIVFTSGKEFLFYQLSFVPPVRDLMFDTSLFKRHQEGIRKYLDQCREAIDKFFKRDCVNYMEGYQPAILKLSLPPQLVKARCSTVVATPAESAKVGVEYASKLAKTNDLELCLTGISYGQEEPVTSPVSREKISYRYFLDTSQNTVHRVMNRVTIMGEKNHTEQQENFNKLTKKPFSDALATETRTRIPSSLSDEKREAHIRKELDFWNDAMICVYLERKVLSGEILLNEDYSQWVDIYPSIGKLRTSRQRINKARIYAFKTLFRREVEWDKKHRRPKIINQALNDFFSEEARCKGGGPGLKEDIRLAAQQAAKRKDGFYDFITWMKPIGISRFGRQWWKYILYQYEKMEVPDNNFSVLIDMLCAIRPIDFQIIKEFAASYEKNPETRLIHLGPLVAANQIEALRRRYGISPLEKTPKDIGQTHYCGVCGQWADVHMHQESKTFKMYGIGLDGATYSIRNKTLNCKKQGTASCPSGGISLKTMDTIGVAVSIKNNKWMTRCASCGIATEFVEGNMTERGPSCGAPHVTPLHVTNKRPANTYLKRRLINISEIRALDDLRKSRLFGGLDERRPKTRCYYCNKVINPRKGSVRTVQLLYTPGSYDPRVAKFRTWVDGVLQRSDRGESLAQYACMFPYSVREFKKRKISTSLSDVYYPTARENPIFKNRPNSTNGPTVRPTPMLITVPLCESCHSECKYWLAKVPIPHKDDFMTFMKIRWKKKSIARATGATRRQPTLPGQPNPFKPIRFNADIFK